MINLLGSGSPAEILAALGVDCIVEQRTLDEITRHPIPGMSHNHVLSTLAANGHVRNHRMSVDEYSLYLSLVSGSMAECLGDGESAAIAVAVSQRRAVILDDGKARRIHDARFATTPVASSLRLFIAAGARSGWNKARMRELITMARRNARMSVVKGEEHLLAHFGII